MIAWSFVASKLKKYDKTQICKLKKLKIIKYENQLAHLMIESDLI